MKKILIVTIFLFTGFSFSVEFKPLSEYLKSADMEDYFTLEYISKRCSALNLTLSTQWFPEGSDIANITQDSYEFYSSLAIDMHMLKNPNKDETSVTLDIIQNILGMVEPLSAVIQDNQDKTGSIFEGSWVQEDLVICTQFQTELQK